MKFSDFYLSPGSRFLSTAAGVLLGGLTALFAGWQVGILTGAVLAIVLSVAIPLMLYLSEKPYAKLVETIKHPLLLDRRVRFTVKGGTVGGHFILTDESMVFLSVERGTHHLELSHKDVHSVVLGEDSTISVFLNNTQFIRVISASGEELYEALRQYGWI